MWVKLGALVGMVLSLACAPSFVNTAVLIDADIGSGSGFLYRGRLVTAGHICAALQEAGQSAEVTYVIDGVVYTAGRFEPQAFVREQGKDACIMQRTGPAQKLGVRELYRGALPHAGDRLVIVGSPLGAPPVMRTDGYAGILADGYLLSSAPVTYGNSGAPVMDANGRVVGVESAVNLQYHHISFITPISVVDALIDANPN